MFGVGDDHHREPQRLVDAGHLTQLAQCPDAQLDDQHVGIPDGELLSTARSFNRVHGDSSQGESVVEVLREVLRVDRGVHRIGR